MNPAHNLFLIGPMGAGKSSIGRRLAARFQLEFIDLDQEIEQRTGAPVTLIFELEGEVGFRRRERELLAEFSVRHGIVLSCGGGVVLDEANRTALTARGFVVWLDAGVEQQLARLKRDRQRPLLATPDRRARLESLAAERNPLYAACADLRVASVDASSPAHALHGIAAAIDAAWQREVTA